MEAQELEHPFGGALRALVGFLATAHLGVAQKLCQQFADST